MSAVAEKWLCNDKIAAHCDFWLTFIANYLKTRGLYRLNLSAADRLERCRSLA